MGESSELLHLPKLNVESLTEFGNHSAHNHINEYVTSIYDNSEIGSQVLHSLDESGFMDSYTHAMQVNSKRGKVSNVLTEVQIAFQPITCG